MTDPSPPLRDDTGRTSKAAGHDAALAAWLNRSLSRQYDAVLAESLPPTIAALARKISAEH